MDEPQAWCGLSAQPGGRELPTSGRLEGKVGEVSARTGGIEFSVLDLSGCVDTHFDSDTNPAVNGIARLGGDVGQDLADDFSWEEISDGRGRLGHGWDRRRVWSCERVDLACC